MLRSCGLCEATCTTITEVPLNSSESEKAKQIGLRNSLGLNVITHAKCEKESLSNHLPTVELSENGLALCTKNDAR